MSKTISTVALALLLLGSMACSSDPTSPSVGRVNVVLTDAPLDLSTVRAVEVTVTELRLFVDDSVDDDNGMEMQRPGLSTGEGMTINLLDYQNGRTVTIGTLEAAPGEYQKIRMKISAAELVIPDPDFPDDPLLDRREPIFISSGKVDIPVRFTVSGGETTEVTLDFDAQLSVQVNTTSGTHPYILRPVIVPVRVAAI